MRVVVEVVWKPQEKGVLNTVANFPEVRKNFNQPVQKGMNSEGIEIYIDFYFTIPSFLILYILAK